MFVYVHQASFTFFKELPVITSYSIHYTKLYDGLAPLSIDGELQKSLKALENEGIKVFTGEETIGETRIGYLQFQTSDFGKIRSTYLGKETTLESRVKAEAYELLGLDSLRYESMPNGAEYTHYLSLSYSISSYNFV